jgi:hypothetical protein
MKLSDELINSLEAEGYRSVTYVNGKGICGLKAFAFTIGLVCGIELDGYDHRYCYPRESSQVALSQLLSWKLSDEEVSEDPQDPYWIKKKGRVEYSNILNPQFDERFDHSFKDFS